MMLRLIIYPLIIVVFIPLYTFLLHIFPPRCVSKNVPSDLGLEYQDITLLTNDGIKLAAWFIPKENNSKAIIVCHGYPMDKGDVFTVAEFLARDYNLLLFDFRAMGKSTGRVSAAGWKEREDFLTAVRFLKEKGFKDIGAFGFSMGAAVIFLADSPDIKCIASDSSYASLEAVLLSLFKNYGPLRYLFVMMMKLWSRLFLNVDINAVAPVKYIAGMKIPIFLIHSQWDTQVPVNQAQLLHKANPQSKLLLIPEGEHGRSLAVSGGEYEKQLLQFFQDHL